MRCVVLVLAICLAVGSAMAQPSLTPPTPIPLAPAPVEAKSTTVAVLLSVGVTSASYVALIGSTNDGVRTLGAIGVFVGPSTGIWYAGELGGMGLGLRALGVVSAAYGLSRLSTPSAMTSTAIAPVGTHPEPTV